MSSYNKVVLLGRLTRDPVCRASPAGQQFSTLNLVVVGQRRKNTATGRWEDEPCFVDVTCAGNLATQAEQYSFKGSLVLVEGHLQQSTWTDKASGTKRWKLYVFAESLQIVDGPNHAKERRDGPQSRSEQHATPPAEEGDPLFGDARDDFDPSRN